MSGKKRRMLNSNYSDIFLYNYMHLPEDNIKDRSGRTFTRMPMLIPDY